MSFSFYQKHFSRIIFLILLRVSNHQIVDKKQGGGGLLGPDPTVPILFHDNPASRSSVISFPSTVFFPSSASHVISWVAVKFRIPSINFVLSRIPHHIWGQIVDPEIPPRDPVYGGQYILVFPPPLVPLASKLLELQKGQRANIRDDFFPKGTIFLMIWRHDSDSTNTHKSHNVILKWERIYRQAVLNKARISALSSGAM